MSLLGATAIVIDNSNTSR